MTLFSAKSTALSGYKAHRWQRLSALFLWGYTLFLLWLITTAPPIHTTQDLAEWLGTPLVLIPGGLAVLLVLIHGWVGLRDMMLDYLPTGRCGTWLTALRIGLLLILFDLLAITAWLVLFSR